jgi:hypothetical protein
MLGVDIDFGRRRVVERPRFGDGCFISLFTRGLFGDGITGDWIGPVGKSSSLLSIEAWLKPTTSLVESARETRWVPANRSTDVLRV